MWLLSWQRHNGPGAIYCSLFVALYDIVERESASKQISWYTRQLQNCVDSVFYQFASTVTVSLAFAIMEACMDEGLC